MSRIGTYEIEEELGRGAMGVVFRAYDPTVDRRVALKVILPQPMASEAEAADAQLRFSREAAVVGKLSHPNIVTLYHMGAERGFVYLVMEYVDGVSSEKLLGKGPIEPARVLPVLRQIADALDYAHSQGVIHRDVKPANILIRFDGRAKLSDFGIAHIQSQTITQTGMTMGTPAYMAPEQILAARLDGRSDQFSLASSTFEILVGRKPFEGATEVNLIFNILHQEAPFIHSANTDLPESCSPVLSRAFEKQPQARFATCTEFVTALASCFERRTNSTPEKPAAKIRDKAEITRLYAPMHRGNDAAVDRLVDFLQDNIQDLAAQFLKAHPNGRMLRPGRLANEAYVQCFGDARMDWKDRARLLAIIARYMRDLLVEHERKPSGKLGGVSVTLAEAHDLPVTEHDIGELGNALSELEGVHPQPARVVELKFFGGLNDKQIGEVVQASLPRVRRDWEFGRAWLFHRLKNRKSKNIGS
jgi:RNA polymerase sigma factor (TIGR02999 family)